MAEEEQGEDPENEVGGGGRNGGAGRDVEVAAEQAGQELSRSGAGGPRCATGRAGGCEGSLGGEAPGQDRRDGRRSHGCAHKAPPAGDLEPAEGGGGLGG